MEEVTELLKTWELEELIPLFTEQLVTIQALSALSVEDIKELIPLAGPRALFLRCWRTWKAEFSSLNLSNIELSLIGGELDPQDIIVLQNQPEKKEDQPKTDGSGQCPELEKLLQTSLDSSSLLGFKGHALAGDSARNLLASVIAKEILTEYKDSTITGVTYYKWANFIKQLFPGERTTTYYIPACTTANGIVLQARGKLVHQVLNKRRRLQKLGALPIGKRNREQSPASSSRSNPSPRPLPDIFWNEDEDGNVEEDLYWLENSSDPWILVEEKWKKSFKTRTRNLHDSDQTIESYFEKYPALKKPHGFLLLHSDFDAAHEIYKDNLFVYFPLMKHKLRELLNKKKAAEAYSHELIRLGDSSNEETSNLVAFLTIPYLLNTSTVRQKKKKKCLEENETWKPTKVETRDGFIKHLKSDAEVSQAVELRLSNLKKKGVPSQPYIIAVGESLDAIKTYLVVANRSVIYERFTIMQAVDTCYKIVWALNAEYGADTYHVWNFIQTGLYKMSSKFDKGSTAVESLLTDCEVQLSQ